MKIKLYVDEVEHPFDGRRKATLVTNDKRFCEMLSKKLTPTTMNASEYIFLAEDVQKAIDKAFVETPSSPSVIKKRLMKELGIK